MTTCTNHIFLLLYNKYNFFKPCLNSIIDRKINDNVPVLINRIDLLQATISASHTCCHYYQYRLFHVIAASHFLFSEFGIFGGSAVHTTLCTQATRKGGVVMQNRENNRGNQNQQTRENSQSQRENRNQDQKESRK